MPNPMIAMIAAGVLSAGVQSNAAGKASDAQTEASQKGLEEQKRQFDQIQKLLSPFVQQGTQALGAQGNLAGLNGQGAQQKAIANLAKGAEMQALTQTGQNAILQNASATGGLRGGNTQGALAQFNQQALSGVINDQYARLGGLAASGQNAAGGLASAGQANANNVSQLYGQIGAAGAGNALAQGQAFGQLAGGVGQMYGRLMKPNNGIIPEGQTMMSQWGFGY